ncbi:MAG TPA: hypothetical protein ENJ08_12885 [Gammaproteobacteria bacterium]|nr:hypothetical protein [Gammaproteobacteria bacterium]
MIFIIVVLFFFYIWFTALKQPPSYGLIVEKYYVCREYKILYGGIFGKGPTRKFSNKSAKSWCWRSEWEEIDRKMFKKLAIEWYGIKWEEEAAYWQRD